MVGSIVVVGALTYSALLHSVCVCVCDLKAAQVILIQERMFYEFELGHNAMEVAKNVTWKVKMKFITVQ